MGFLRCTRGSPREAPSHLWCRGVVVTTPLCEAHVDPLKPPGDAPPLLGW